MNTNSTTMNRVAIAGLLLAAVSTSHAQTWSRVASMPTPRANAGSVAIDGKLYVVGGGASDQWTGHSAALEIYDPRLDRWTEAAPVPRPRYKPIVEQVDGKLYAIGGFPDQGDCYVYDPQTDSWSGMSFHVGGGITGFGTVSGVIDGKIWIVTGRADVWVYDPAIGGRPERVDPGKPHRRYVQGGVIGEEIYLVGGFIPQSVPTPTVPAPDVDVYNTRTGTWRSAAPMIRPRFGAGTAISDGKLYVIGGYTREDPLAALEAVLTTEMYDPGTDTWTEHKVRLPDRVSMSFAFLDGTFYAIGGRERVGGIAGFDPTDRVDALEFGRRFDRLLLGGRSRRLFADLEARRRWR